MSVLVVSVFWLVSVLVVSVLVVDDVSVGGGGACVDVVVSVAGGGGCVAVVSVGAGRGRRRGCGCCDCDGGGCDEETVSVVVGAEDALVIEGIVDVGVLRGAAGAALVVAGGSDPATVFGAVVCEPIGAGLSSSVRFVVVSAPVFVIGGVVSPGALMVEVTPLACPS